MTGFIIAIVVVALVGVLVVVLRGRGGPKDESLGAPHQQSADPLIRAESRHHDTPAASDVEQRGGREHD